MCWSTLFFLYMQCKAPAAWPDCGLNWLVNRFHRGMLWKQYKLSSYTTSKTSCSKWNECNRPKGNQNMFMNWPAVREADIAHPDLTLFPLEKIRSFQAQQPVNHNYKRAQLVYSLAAVNLLFKTSTANETTNLDCYSFFGFPIQWWDQTKAAIKKKTAAG